MDRKDTRSNGGETFGADRREPQRQATAIRAALFKLNNLLAAACPEMVFDIKPTDVESRNGMVKQIQIGIFEKL